MEHSIGAWVQNSGGVATLQEDAIDVRWDRPEEDVALDDTPIAASSVPLRGAELFARLVKDAGSRPVPMRDFSLFHRWVMVRGDHWSFAPHFCSGNLRTEESEIPEDFSSWLGWSASEVARRTLASSNPTCRSLGLACLKAALARPADAVERDSFEILEPLAERMRTLVIGFFPQARIWKERGWRTTILEPGPSGDVEWPNTAAVGSAELVVASGSILLGGWLRDLVRHTPRAKARILVGPTVPPSPSLFRMGVHGLGFSEVADPGVLAEYFRHGAMDLRGAPDGAVRKFHWSCRENFVADLLRSTL